MEIIEAKSVLPYIINSKPIGIGATAICFLKDGMVFKKYMNTDTAHKLLIYGDMMEKLQNLSEISNDTYVGPQKVILVNGKIKGYMYPYEPGKTLNHVNSDIKLFDLFKGYEKLVKDTKLISNQRFKLVDVHCTDIVFNGDFKVIDNDRGRITYGSYNLYHNNTKKLFDAIMRYIFKVYQNYILQPVDSGLRQKIDHTDVTDMNDINELLEYIADMCDDENPSVKKVRKKIEVESTLDEYHRYYI